MIHRWTVGVRVLRHRHNQLLSSYLGLLERVASTVKHFFDIKRSQKVSDSFSKLNDLNRFRVDLLSCQ